MFTFIYPAKDNTITDVTIDGISRTGSNSGASEVLELYSLTSSVSSRGKSRILMYFDVSSLSSSISAGQIPSSSVKYNLFLKNATHAETVPYSFDVEVCPLSQTWAEGRGLSMYDEDLRDSGPSNWSMATSITNWGASGSSYISSSTFTASQYFETGHEDLSIDISNIVGKWLTGGLANNGLVIKYQSAYENASQDFFVKKFFSRNAHSSERSPKVIAQWEKTVQDDRKNIFYGVSGSLYYYRYINGVANNLGQVFVNIINSSSVVVQTLTASRAFNGVYHASGVMVMPATGTQIYRDVWFSSTTQYFTGNFAPQYASGSSFYDYDNFTLDIPNLTTFQYNERVVIRVFIRDKDYRPALVSYAGQNPIPVLMKDAYYQIQNAETEEILVDYSTGSLKYSKLSYDENGNYFELWTDALKPEYLYKIRILVNDKNQSKVFDKNFTFKIEQ